MEHLLQIVSAPRARAEETLDDRSVAAGTIETKESVYMEQLSYRHTPSLGTSGNGREHHVWRDLATSGGQCGLSALGLCARAGVAVRVLDHFVSDLFYDCEELLARPHDLGKPFWA